MNLFIFVQKFVGQTDAILASIDEGISQAIEFAEEQNERAGSICLHRKPALHYYTTIETCLEKAATMSENTPTSRLANTFHNLVFEKLAPAVPKAIINGENMQLVLDTSSCAPGEVISASLKICAAKPTQVR